MILTIALLGILWMDVQSQVLYETKGSFALQLSPLALIDRNPRIKMGIEYHGFNKLGYSIDIGWGKSFLRDLTLLDGPWEKDYFFFEILPELKWYSFESAKFESFYALTLHYSILTDQLTTGDYYDKNSIQRAFSQASFYRHKIGLILKAGNKWHFSDNMFLDLSAGFGVAYRDIAYDDVTEIVTDDFNTGEWFISPHKKEGNYFVPQFVVNMKFGVIIN